MLTGSIDRLDRYGVSGWVRDTAFPEAPVAIIVTANGRLLGRFVANTFRADLVEADIGSGRFGFDVVFDPPLVPTRSWLIQVRAEADGVYLPGSPRRLPASSEFDDAARRGISAMLAGFASAHELDERLAFVSAERDRLLQARAGLRSGKSARVEARRRALVIDHQIPRPDHDGGSTAILSHMRSLRRLGYNVVFATPSMVPAPALEQAGFECYARPWYNTIEDVLRRESDGFDLVYLHRVSVASTYVLLARQTQRRARLIYSVADLHHVRLLRQAAFEARPELMAEAERVRAMELWSAQAADAVITHSSAEARLLRPLLPKGRVHVVAWSMPSVPVRRPFAERSGAALIGHFPHGPNAAAAWILRDEIVPLVQRADPSIECVLVGERLQAGLQAPRPGYRYAGHVACLTDVFEAVRLTVAPLPFGSGLKGKVLASLSVGVPCVCSPIAAEGMDLPPRLQELVAPDAAATARLIVRLHNDEPFHARLSNRCRTFAERRFSEPALDAALQRVVEPKR